MVLVVTVAAAFCHLQEKRLNGLGAAIPPHAARQAKRDREWREFLDRRTSDSSAAATASPRPSASQEVRLTYHLVCSLCFVLALEIVLALTLCLRVFHAVFTGWKEF